MTTRPPWRPADVADAILGRRTRPSLPVEQLASGGPDDEGHMSISLIGLDTGGVDEVYILQQPRTVVMWFMRLGRPREDH